MAWTPTGQGLLRQMSHQGMLLAPFLGIPYNPRVLNRQLPLEMFPCSFTLSRNLPRRLEADDTKVDFDGRRSVVDRVGSGSWSRQVARRTAGCAAEACLHDGRI